jgi:hypothetical protein
LKFISPAVKQRIPQKTYQRKGHKNQEYHGNRKKNDDIQYAGEAAILEGVSEKRMGKENRQDGKQDIEEDQTPDIDD